MANWYVSSVAHTAVAQFAISHAYSIGNIVRQLAAPSTGNERCFRCTTAGTSAGSESAWTLTKAATTAQGTATFTEVTGNETWQGTSWAAPFARLQSPSNSWPANGDTLFVSSDHAETQSTAMSLVVSGNRSTPSKMICVTRPSSAIPPATADLASTATVTTTGNSALAVETGVTNTGQYVYGITFSCGTGANSLTLQTSGNGGCFLYEQCTFNIPATGATSKVLIGESATLAVSGELEVWKNCTVNLANATATIQPSKPLLWNGGTYANSATQTGGAFANKSGATTTASQGHEIRNVDMSTATGASGYYVDNTNWNFPRVGFSFIKCKIPATVLGYSVGTRSNFGDLPIDIVDCSSTTTLINEIHDRAGGTWQADTANYLTAGASDGTTHKSWKAVTNTVIDGYSRPFEMGDIFLWLTAASHTLSLYCANTSSITLKDNEFGFEVEYMADATSPKGTLASTFSPTFGTGSSLATTAVAWTGLSSPTRQVVAKTITTAQAGWCRVRPIIKRASLTLWVDPLVAVT